LVLLVPLQTCWGPDCLPSLLQLLLLLLVVRERVRVMAVASLAASLLLQVLAL
jgi:hypothetical protein